MSDATFLRTRRVPLALAALATVLGLMAGTASALPPVGDGDGPTTQQEYDDKVAGLATTSATRSRRT